MTNRNVLTDKKVASITKPGRYGDGRGLYLQVSQFGTKAWIYRYTIGGHVRDMGLGSAGSISLKLARELAREQHTHLLRGDDPIELRKSKRERIQVERAARKTFRECAEGFLAKHAAEWRSDRHRHEVKRTLDIASKHFGDTDVAAIDTSHVTTLLEPIWRKTPSTGSRVAMRVAGVLDWATAAGYRTGLNPARWKGHLEHLLAAVPKATHMDSMAFTAVPDFMQKLRAVDTTIARALEFTILTASRGAEARGARRDEIDGDVWVIPASRMKTHREHRVPLSDRAIELLNSMPRDSSGLVFPGRHAGSPVADNGLLKLLKRMTGTNLSVHGFRASFRDWAAERTAYPREIIEMCLAHKVAGKVESAYWRGDILGKRRRLMNDWSRYCDSPAVSGTVTALRSA
jgi:integrase